MERRLSSSSTLSFSSIDDSVNLNLSFKQNQKDEPSKAEKFANRIINIFTEPKRLAFIDIDDSSALITVEESEKRLVYLQFGLACLFSTFALFLIGLNVGNKVGHDLRIVLPEISKRTSKGSIPVPTVALIDQSGDGNLTKFFVSNELVLQEEWSIKLPNAKLPQQLVSGQYDSRDEMAPTYYLGFSYKRALYIMTLDGHKNMTILYSNKTHRVLKKQQN